MSLDEHIRTVVEDAVGEATAGVLRSKECMNAEEAREFLGLTKDEWYKRRHLIYRREESERKSYYLREDLLEYVRSLPRRPEESKSDYGSDYGRHATAYYGVNGKKKGA